MRSCREIGALSSILGISALRSGRVGKTQTHLIFNQ